MFLSRILGQNDLLNKNGLLNVLVSILLSWLAILALLKYEKNPLDDSVFCSEKLLSFYSADTVRLFNI